ncbi:MAG: hypothetical protein ILP10_00320 [Lachnospiraceae bacterium]|nr:hypothetical protein [Lachnospiraceae bacterium]
MNIDHVVDSGKCDGCCGCISACTRNSIFMLFNRESGHPVPFVSGDCDGCGACLKVCAHYEPTVSVCAEPILMKM